ncbi:Hpt domain-containing protein [Azovibrio restrictus]|uniref:Hpt domain-containing protein n=1 Tax=Azovibrio restrictus TaxID=146938 RepID=UPI0026EB5E6A|nr:Hpt domain-containing protein [Azovibrio restrictus]MDD3482540.1 Hpt domain-containing protein [Azovibrio restrictus]
MSEALPLLNTEAALGRIRGKTDLYRRLLEQAEPHRQAASLALAARAEADWEALRKIAHRVVGVAASLGAERLAAVARQLEQLAGAGDPGEPNLESFVQVLPQTFAAIDAYLGREPESCCPGEPWCQVRQTVQMLELAAGQIHVAMRDSNLSVEALMGAFGTMAERLQHLESRLQAISGDEVLGAEMHEVSSAMDEALVALQFYDRLAQRLEHVEHGLGHLATLLADAGQRGELQAWEALQEEIRSRYTTEEERIMFASVMGGMPVAEAIAHYKETVLTRTGNDGRAEVELF